MSLNPLPWPYYFTFAVYEPLLVIISSIWAFTNPREAFNAQAPWATPDAAGGELSAQANVTILQLVNVSLLMGLLNLSIINTARGCFTQDPRAQEVVYKALFTVLMFGDFAHIAVTLYAMGPEVRWEFGGWSALTWVTILSGVSLLVPRALWHLGVGRGVPTQVDTKPKKQM